MGKSDAAPRQARICEEVVADPDNMWAVNSDHKRLDIAAPFARSVLIGQARSAWRGVRDGLTRRQTCPRMARVQEEMRRAPSTSALLSVD